MTSILFTLGRCAPLPEQPYWCRDANGRYITKVTANSSSSGGTAVATAVAAEPCNAEAARAGGRYALLMMLAALGEG